MTTVTAHASIEVELDVEAQMRDGVTLRANVYRPKGDGPWPTLLTRLPYGKDDSAFSRLDPIKAARDGFLVVVQDTRGRFKSDGEWLPLRFERQDGYDSVEWAARLRGSNGRVGMFSDSYVGNTQWMAALAQAPSLAAISPALTWSEPLDGLFARGGALELGVAVAWTLVTGAAHLAKLTIPDEERIRRLQWILDDYDRLSTNGYWDLPVHDMALLHRHDMPDPGTFRMRSDPDFPKWCRVAGVQDQVTIPTFHVGGWYDAFVQGTLDNYAALAASGRPARLLVGPWSHVPRLADPVGALCFGVRSAALGVPAHEHGDLSDVQLKWFHRHLGHEVAPSDEEPPVRIFVMGRNEWRNEECWPPPKAEPQRWFLSGGGWLDPGAPGSNEEPTRFTYDPADPAPTLGGHTVMPPEFPSGPLDQTLIEARHDVCVFTSELLQEELEVTGRVTMFLHVQSSSPSTDWVARLCDVHPDGRSFNVCDGIVRLRDGANIGQRVEIDLWSTCNVFLPGHRLRVHVTSSSFPRWDRNLNTGNQDEPRMEIARQSLYHDADRASYVELPVVRR